jgi:hypothetical protein
MTPLNFNKPKKVKKTTRTAIIKKLDVLFSKQVRERDRVYDSEAIKYHGEYATLNFKSKKEGV